MLTPPVTDKSGLNANFSSGVIVDRFSYAAGISGFSASALRLASFQSASNQDH